MTNEKRERALAALDTLCDLAWAHIIPDPADRKNHENATTGMREAILAALQPSAVERVIDKGHDPRQDTDQPRGSLFEEDESMGLSFPCCACKHRSRAEVLCRPFAHCAR